ncbi:MAG: hypothetical protein ABSD71_09055 [Bacteroidales bacterium]|jgi:hypothetical protein
MEKEKTYDLEDRLITFAVKITDLIKFIPRSMGGKYLAAQIIRSGLSPALN